MIIELLVPRYHLSIAILVSLLFLTVIRIIRRRYYACRDTPFLLKFLRRLVVTYLLLIVVVHCHEVYILYDLRSYDINHDGIISDIEITEQYKQALKRYIMDTARTFAPITGIFYSFILTIFTLIIELLAKKVLTIL